ncbi:hypothetical protein AAY473_004165 [Plecturocebus cupreus]
MRLEERLLCKFLEEAGWASSLEKEHSKEQLSIPKSSSAPVPPHVSGPRSAAQVLFPKPSSTIKSTSNQGPISAPYQLYVTLDDLRNLSEPQFSLLKNGITRAFNFKSHRCSAVARSRLTANFTSQVQAILLPQAPEQLELPLQSGFHHVVQNDLELLTSGGPPAYASQSAGITAFHSMPCGEA